MLNQQEEFQHLEQTILKYDQHMRSSTLTPELMQQAQTSLDALAAKYQHDPNVGGEKARLYELQALIEISKGNIVRANDFIRQAQMFMTPQDQFISSAVREALHHTTTAQAATVYNDGIRGWLILYAIRIVLLPLVFLFDLKTFSEVGDLGLASIMPMVYVGYVADGIAIIAGAVGIYMFFSQRKIARMYFRAMELYMAAYYIFFALWLTSFLSDYGILDTTTYTRSLWVGFVIAIAWVLYWFNSHRAKATFVK